MDSLFWCRKVIIHTPPISHKAHVHYMHVEAPRDDDMVIYFCAPSYEGPYVDYDVLLGEVNEGLIDGAVEQDENV